MNILALILQLLLPCSSLTHKLIGWVKTLPSRLKLPRAQLMLWMQSRSSGDSGPTTGWLLVGTHVPVPASSIPSGSGRRALPNPALVQVSPPAVLPAQRSQRAARVLGLGSVRAGLIAILQLDVRFLRQNGSGSTTCSFLLSLFRGITKFVKQRTGANSVLCP